LRFGPRHRAENAPVFRVRLCRYDARHLDRFSRQPNLIAAGLLGSIERSVRSFDDRGKADVVRIELRDANASGNPDDDTIEFEWSRERGDNVLADRTSGIDNLIRIE
jgi:hypothetical protein